ncbi:hypothetical protein IV02_15810 [Pseudomonas syringae]|jgi:hypothetical protein|uniref:Uncharacterized protein n=1 Tax=Pseudomonas syringae TaxID=317 RepID=A0A085V623_PSESX|nr:hypothetical protein CFII64_13758 [Pseudomonas sp. CFII64]KFE50886.1 hypothetical protein IV02_15810 [Pseudomonas syringae]
MKLLSNHQISNVLEARLRDYKVSCKGTDNNVISLVLTHAYTQAVYGVSGIRPADYRGPYGATILAKTLLEAIQSECVAEGSGIGKVISITRPVEPRPAPRNLTVLKLLAGH